MFKKTLFVATAAIALAAASSLPASARALGNAVADPTPQSVPEPMSVFGVIAFAGGSLLAKKRAESNKAE